MATNYLLVLDDGGRYRDHFELAAETRRFRGWQETVSGWSIGSMQSVAPIRIDEPKLDHAHLGIVPASNHVLLYGHLGDDADIDIERAAPNESGIIEVRFDQTQLRIGRFVIQYFYSLESLEDRVGALASTNNSEPPPRRRFGFWRTRHTG